MIDIVTQINATHRELGERPLSTGEGRSLLLRRAYSAALDDVWNACTDRDRLARWLGHVAGDLRLGGDFELEGNASGRILECDEPRLLKLTWEFGGGMYTEVEVRLSEGEDGTCVFELEHASPAEVVDGFVKAYGPGGTLGVGAGWDLTVLALTRHLDGERFDAVGWESEADARAYAVESCRAWGAIVQAAWGTSDDDIAAAIEFAAQQFAAESADPEA